MAKITYSFKDVVAAIVGPGGIINLGQSAGPSSEGITIDPTGDINTMTIGADGSGMHSLSADRSGRLTMRFMKTAPTNGLLMLMYNFQISSGATHGQNTITVVDTARGENVTAQLVAFKKAPALHYAMEGGLVEWEFEAVQIDRVLASV